MPRRREVLVSTAALGLLPGCDRAGTPAPALQPIRIALDLWAGYYPVMLADELGYLRDAGVAISIALPGDTDRMMSEFAAGRHDLICCSLGDLINLTRGRQDVQVVLATDESAGGDVIFMRHGVDLRGSEIKVATNLGGFGEMFVREFLSRRGVDVARVQWINADASRMAELLSGHVVDIGHTWEPYASQVDATAAERVFSSADTPGLIPDVAATTVAFIERRRKDLQALLAAWLRALAWWQANPAQGNALLAKRLNLSAAAVAPQGVRLIGLDENRKALGAAGATPAMAAMVNRYSEFFLARGQLTRPVQASTLLRGDLLP